jgi:hypothetical protein
VIVARAGRPARLEPSRRIYRFPKDLPALARGTTVGTDWVGDLISATTILRMTEIGIASLGAHYEAKKAVGA